MPITKSMCTIDVVRKAVGPVGVAHHLTKPFTWYPQSTEHSTFTKST